MNGLMDSFVSKELAAKSGRMAGAIATLSFFHVNLA